MKKSLSFLLLFGLALISCKLHSQICNTNDACPVVGDPYIEDNCFASIERYLARSIAMDGLTRMINQGQSWPSECMDSTYACNASYASCPLGGYCPQRYCDDISLLVDLNIAFIRRAAHLWNSEHRMKIGAAYYVAAQKVIIDINRAYDCAGLRRPIIQAAILENITEDVNQVPIPQYVIDAFSDDVDFDASFLTGRELFFDVCKIAKDECAGYPDINKIQTRMWFYYLATNYIDFGYTALHFGQIKIMAEYDSGNIKSYTLFQKIRNYATSKGTFVIIDAHTDFDLYLEQTNKLLLDFNSFPLRPTDTHANHLGEACSEDYKIRLSGLEGIFNKSEGGMSPLGCWYEQTPYFVEIDHYTPYPGNIGQLYPEEYIVWGYDEMNYFHNLSAGCKVDFVNYTYSRVREIDYNGFFQFPGRRRVGSWDIPGDLSFYRLYDNPALIKEMKNILSPSLDVEIDFSFTEEEARADCYKVMYRDYDFEVKNADMSSYLTWHIKKPDGNWENYTPGESRRYRPLQEGTYTIYLRQDNLALPELYGSRTLSVQIEIPKLEYIDQCNQDSISNDEVLEEILENHFMSHKEGPIVYPNPTTNVINIDMKDFRDKAANVMLVDMLGRVIFSDRIFKNNQVYASEIPEVAAGVYNLIIQQEDNKFNHKLVIKNKF